MSDVPDPTPYERIGGEAGLRRMTQRMYALMDTLPEAAAVRAQHPSSLEGSEQKLSVPVAVGSFVLINNLFWLHGRDRFTPHDGLRREQCLGNVLHTYAPAAGGCGSPNIINNDDRFEKFDRR